MRLASVLALGVLAAPVVGAQTTVGVRTGVVYAAPLDADEGISGRAGLGLVVFADRPVGGMVLGGEAGVLQGGFRQRVTTGTSDEPSTLRARVTVFTMAPTVAVGTPAGTLGTRSDVRLEGFVGPRLDFRLAESGRLDGQTGRLEEYDDTMLGLAAGAGVRVPIGPTTMRFDVRTSWMHVTPARSELQTELRVGLTL